MEVAIPVVPGPMWDDSVKTIRADLGGVEGPLPFQVATPEDDNHPGIKAANLLVHDRTSGKLVIVPVAQSNRYLRYGLDWEVPSNLR